MHLEPRPFLENCKNQWKSGSRFRGFYLGFLFREHFYVNPEILAFLASAEPEPSNWALAGPWQQKRMLQIVKRSSKSMFSTISHNVIPRCPRLYNANDKGELWHCFAPVDRGRIDICIYIHTCPRGSCKLLGNELLATVAIRSRSDPL